MSHVLNPTRRNGLRQNEIERKYAKAYESTYMTEQLAKLVVCVSHQTQQLRSRTPTCPVQFPSVSASESHSSSLVRWPKPSKIPRPSTCPVHRTCQREQLLLAVRKTKLQSQSQPSNKRDLRLGSTTAENFTVARTQMITDAKQLNRNESDILVSSSLGLTYFDIHERVERVECDVPLNVFWTYFERTLNVLWTYFERTAVWKPSALETSTPLTWQTTRRFTWAPWQSLADTSRYWESRCWQR